MKNKNNVVVKYYLLIILFLFYFPLLSFPQTKEELAKQKQQIEKEIEYTGKLIEETRQGKKSSLELLIALNKKISLRQQYINTINRQISQLDKQIVELSSIVEALESDLKKVKEEYARMILFAYRNRNAQDRLAFVFSSSDFQQAYKRAKFLRQYSQLRQKQAKVIDYTRQVLSDKISALEEKRAEKRGLLLAGEAEKKSLANEKTEQSELYESLKQKESSLKDDLKKKQAQASKLQKAIEDIIAEELRKAREAAKGKASFELTPEAMELSSTFSKNKGKLPWPVERGIITSHFGLQEHPVLKGIKINNNGIDIATSAETQARAIFEGIVTGVVVLPGSQKAVIVQHGEYFTVYGNLNDVLVQKGDKVAIRQPLGTILTGEESRQSEAHLELWKMKKDGSGTMKLNPEEWILNK